MGIGGVLWIHHNALFYIMQSILLIVIPRYWLSSLPGQSMLHHTGADSTPFAVQAIPQTFLGLFSLIP